MQLASKTTLLQRRMWNFLIHCLFKIISPSLVIRSWITKTRKNLLEFSIHHLAGPHSYSRLLRRLLARNCVQILKKQKYSERFTKNLDNALLKYGGIWIGPLGVGWLTTGGIFLFHHILFIIFSILILHVPQTLEHGKCSIKRGKKTGHRSLSVRIHLAALQLLHNHWSGRSS